MKILYLSCFSFRSSSFFHHVPRNSYHSFFSDDGIRACVLDSKDGIIILGCWRSGGALEWPCLDCSSHLPRGELDRPLGTY